MDITAEPVAGDALKLVSVAGRFEAASNLTLLAVDEAGRQWVYKPSVGVSPLWDFPADSLPAREILAYEVSQAMGIEAVPETVAASGPFGPGSGQRLIEEDFDFDPRPLFAPQLDPVLWPVAVLDTVCNNADRKLGHLIKERTSPRIWAIDNGLTFHPDPKLRTVLWGFAGQRLPMIMIEAITRLHDALAAGLGDRVAALLSKSEAEVLIKRVAGLLKNPVHPHPPNDRPAVPWPIW